MSRENQHIHYDSTMVYVGSYTREFSEKSIGYQCPSNDRNIVSVADMNGKTKGFTLTTSFPGTAESGMNELEFLKKMAVCHMTDNTMLSFSQRITPYFQLIIDIDIKVKPDYHGYWTDSDEWILKTGAILCRILKNIFPALADRDDSFPLFVVCAPATGISVERNKYKKLGCHFRSVRRCAYEGCEHMDWSRSVSSLPIDLHTGLYVNVKESLYIRNTLIQEMRKELPGPPGDLSYEEMVDEAIYKKGGLRFLHHGKKPRKCGSNHKEHNCDLCSPVTPGFITSSRKYICKYSFLPSGKQDPSFIEKYRLNDEHNVDSLVRTWWMLSIGLYTPVDKATCKYYQELIESVKALTLQGDFVASYKTVPIPSDYMIQDQVLKMYDNSNNLIGSKRGNTSCIDNHNRNSAKISYETSSHGKVKLGNVRDPCKPRGKLQLSECRYDHDTTSKIIRYLTNLITEQFPHTMHNGQTIRVKRIKRKSDPSITCAQYKCTSFPCYWIEVIGGTSTRCLEKLSRNQDDGYHSSSHIYFQMLVDKKKRLSLRQKCWSSKCSKKEHVMILGEGAKMSKSERKVREYLFTGYADKTVRMPKTSGKSTKDLQEKLRKKRHKKTKSKTGSKCLSERARAYMTKRARTEKNIS